MTPITIWTEVEYEKSLTAEREAHAATKAKLAVAEESLTTETEIVDRTWAIFGRPSYESLNGKSIYDLINAEIEGRKNAELDRDRWKAVHDRGWKGWRGQDHGYVSDREGFDIASGSTLEAALDAAFALFPLEPK